MNCTPATPTLSAALAVTEVVPETVAPDAGAVMLTVGGVMSGGALDTVTVTGSEVDRRPWKSRATAVRVWEALPVVVVSQETEYGADVSSAPKLAPSSVNWTPTTVREPMIVTLAETGTEPETLDPDLGDVMVTMRLPTPWARAGVEALETKQEITTNTAARNSLMLLPHRAMTRRSLRPATTASQLTWEASLQGRYKDKR